MTQKYKKTIPPQFKTVFFPVSPMFYNPIYPISPMFFGLDLKTYAKNLLIKVLPDSNN